MYLLYDCTQCASFFYYTISACLIITVHKALSAGIHFSANLRTATSALVVEWGNEVLEWSVAWSSYHLASRPLPDSMRIGGSNQWQELKAGFPLANIFARSDFFPLSLRFRLKQSGTDRAETKEKSRFARKYSLVENRLYEQIACKARANDSDCATCT